MKKLICVLLALVLAVLSLSGCARRNRYNNSSVDSEPISSAAVSQAGMEQARDLLLCVDLDNDALEIAFLARLEEWGCVNDSNIYYSESEWPQGGAGVVITDGTVALQGDVTVVYAGDGKPGSGISVASAASLNDLIDLALESAPELKTLGVLYPADSETAAAQVQAAESYCREKEITLEQVTVNSTEEISQSAGELCARVDALLTPRDALLFGSQGATVIGQAVSAGNIPWYTQDVSIVKYGAVASVGPDYEALGSAAADLCVELLLGRDAAQVSGRTVNEKKITVNQQVLATLNGIKLPDEVMEIADLIAE